ncbi:MAG: metalloregulator ArsR/SmtB family transcription factor [Gammaproteobacteria bacterium]|nr:metalloregulator ArsR/SmtB family transcription factor [Gammaproteobacteria bacterium]
METLSAEHAVNTLAALAQPSRLAVFRLLVRAGPAGLAAGEIAERLDIPSATLSFHLAQLSQAGLVAGRRAGRSIIYAADYRAMDGLIGYLTEKCCAGTGDRRALTG